MTSKDFALLVIGAASYIEKVAFDIPAPNAQTPELVSAAIELKRHAALFLIEQRRLWQGG